MAEQKEKEEVAGTPGAEEKESNPFEGFVSESYTAGELDVDESDEGEDKEEESTEEKPEVEKSEKPDVLENEDKTQEQSVDDEEAGDAEYSERVRARISKLTRKRRDAERRLRDLELENARLKGERESAPPAEIQKEVKQKQVEKPVTSSQEVPDPKKYRYGSLDNDYIADLSKFNARAVIEEERKAYREQREQEQRNAAQNEYDRKRQAVYERGEVEIDDFEDIVIGGSISEQNPDGWVASPLIADLILDSEVGHKVAYYLAKNPAESREIYNKSTYEQTRYFNKIEAKFLKDEETGGEEETLPKKTVKAPPKAPPPPTKPRGAGGNFEPSSQTDDFLAFEKMVRDKGLI